MSNELYMKGFEMLSDLEAIEIQEQGYKAFENSESLDNNPYKDDKMRSELWEDGWLAADDKHWEYMQDEMDSDDCEEWED